MKRTRSRGARRKEPFTATSLLFRKFLRAYGRAAPPKEIWQESLDRAEKAYPRLIALTQDLPKADEAEASDLHSYATDLVSMPVQSELFSCVLPVCMRAWQRDLWDSSKYGGVIEQFSAALARRPLIDDFLSEKQARAVKGFMREAILERLDAENSLSHAGKGASPYGWVEKLGSFCVIVSELDRLWTRWWAFETPGRAVAALQYISSLMYEEDNNPIFRPWRPDKGGGPLCLWETDGHIYRECWRPENVQFFRDTVTVDCIFDALKRAQAVMDGIVESNVPSQMIDDFQYLDDVVAHRVRELADIVSCPLINSPSEWPPLRPS